MIYRSLSWWTVFSRIKKTTMNGNKYNFSRDLNTAQRDMAATFLANLVGLTQARGDNFSQMGRIGQMMGNMSRGYTDQRDFDRSNQWNNNTSLSAMGQQGSLDLPRPFGLSGSSVKWYYRYLQQGVGPVEARRMAKQHIENFRSTSNLGRGGGRLGERSSTVNGTSSRNSSTKYQGRSVTEANKGRGALPPRPVEGRPARLSGACRRWNQRYLKDGFSPAEALRKALQHSEKYREMSSGKEKSRNQSQTVSRPKKSLAEEKSSTLKDEKKKVEIPPPGQTGVRTEPPRKGLSGAGNRWFMRYLKQGFDYDEAKKKAESHKRRRSDDDSPPAETPPLKKKKRSRNAPSRDNAEKFEEVGIVPKDFPEVSLSTDDLTALENAIVAEMALGWEHKLQFNGIYFRPSMLLLHCKTPQTVEWIKQVITKLKNWEGVPLRICDENAITNAQVVSMILPKSAGQTLEVSLGLIESQNEGLSTKCWSVIKSSDVGPAQHLTCCIDDASKQTLAKLDWKLSYRFGKVVIRLRTKNVPSKTEVEPSKTEAEQKAETPQPESEGEQLQGDDDVVIVAEDDHQSEGQHENEEGAEEVVDEEIDEDVVEEEIVQEEALEGETVEEEAVEEEAVEEEAVEEEAVEGVEEEQAKAAA